MLPRQELRARLSLVGRSLVLALARTGVPKGVGLGFVPLRPGGSRKVEAAGLEPQTVVVAAVVVVAVVVVAVVAVAAAAAIAGPLVVVAGIDPVVAAAAVEEGTSGEAEAVVAGPMAR
jgi:hypothetical protein